MSDQVAELAASVATSARALRRSIHRHPELGWCEIGTTALIRDELASVPGLSIRSGATLYDGVARMGLPEEAIFAQAMARAAEAGLSNADIDAYATGHTGLVATYEGSGNGPTIAIRADMDALPLSEREDADHLPAREGFASSTPGVMHACAHDAHMAIAVSAAQAIARLDPPPMARIKCLFQPAEEGTRGADAFVKAGLVDDVDYLLTFHLLTNVGLAAGEVAPRVSSMLPTKKLRVELTGWPFQFASSPHRGRNALTVGAAIALLANAIPKPPGSRSMINIGRFEAGTASNIVPASGVLIGEIRADDADDLGVLERQFEGLVGGLANAFGVQQRIVPTGYATDPVHDPTVVAIVADAIAAVDGFIERPPVPLGASDDASLLIDRVQERGGGGTYIAVGGGPYRPHHTPDFDIDESVLQPSIELLMRTILSLSHQKTRQ